MTFVVDEPVEIPRLLTFAQLLAKAAEAPDWFLDGVLTGDGMSLLCGDPKTGKTTFARCLALAAVRGIEFLNRLPVKGSAVLVTLEDSARKTAAHLEEIGARPDDPLYFATRSQMPDDPDDWETALRHWIGTHQPALAIVDPLQDFLKIRDLNDYSEVSESLAKVTAIARDNSCHIQLVHHAKKDGGEDGKSALGSQALFAKPDTVLTLRRDEDGTRYLSTRQREGEDLEPVKLIKDATGWIDIGETREAGERRRVDETIMAALENAAEPLSKNAILGVAGGRKANVMKAVDRLVKDGLVQRLPDRKFKVVPVVPGGSGEAGTGGL